MSANRNKLYTTAKAGFAISLFCVAVMLGCASLGVLGYQIYTYLYYGNWASIDVVDGFLLVLIELDLQHSSFAQWLNYPEAWVGVRDQLVGFSLALFLMALAIVVMIFAMNISDEY